MNKPLRVYVVEVIRDGIAKPVHVTPNEAEATLLAGHYNDWSGENDPDGDMTRVHAVVRQGRVFYSSLPYGECSKTSDNLQGGAA